MCMNMDSEILYNIYIKSCSLYGETRGPRARGQTKRFGKTKKKKVSCVTGSSHPSCRLSIVFLLPSYSPLLREPIHLELVH
jgi:hypothetical protein